MKDTPIVIISFNRVKFLAKLVDRLFDDGYKNLHVIDNASFDANLLAYYEQFRGKRFNLIASEQNLGSKAIWAGGFHKQFDGGYYAVTDCDILPDQYNFDFLLRFREIMDRHQVDKVGFLLHTDDLPPHYQLRKAVITWEKHITGDEVEPFVFRSPIGMSFALCRPGFDGRWTDNALRCLWARHLSWYCHVNDADENRYIRSCDKGSTHWSRIMSRRIS